MSPAPAVLTGLGPIKLSVNRLHFDEDAGQTLDITLKRLKHWWVERMDAKTADAFGLSRAILCNDVLARLMEKLEANQTLYSELTRHADSLVANHLRLAEAQNTIGSMYSEIAARETLPEVNKYLDKVAQVHRQFKKEATPMLAKVRTIADAFRTYTEKAIPDTKDTIKKYLDKKFEYLSFCLKIKEMDDEEAQMAEFGDYALRLESGNVEYRWAEGRGSESWVQGDAAEPGEESGQLHRDAKAGDDQDRDAGREAR